MHQGGCGVASRPAPSPGNFTNVNEWGWSAAVTPASRARVYRLRPAEIMLLPLALHHWWQFRLGADKPARAVPAAAPCSRAGCCAHGSDVPAAGTRATQICSVTQNSSRDRELTVISLSSPPVVVFPLHIHLLVVSRILLMTKPRVCITESV